MRLFPLIAAGLALVATAAEADMELSFTWGDIPLCTSGRPNVVPNPRFELSGVPPGTEAISFRLTDLDVPAYPHGGGTVAPVADGVIEPGVFTYKSPCPPSGSHVYEWEAVAQVGGKVLATARARRSYPE